MKERMQKTSAFANDCPQRDRSETEWYGGVQTFMWMTEDNIVEVPFDRNHSINYRYYYLSYTIIAATTFTLVIAAIIFVLSICCSCYCLSAVSFAVAVFAFCGFHLCGSSSTSCSCVAFSI